MEKARSESRRWAMRSLRNNNRTAPIRLSGASRERESGRMKTRKLSAEDFNAFLQKNRKTRFGIRENDCPLARWLGEEITIEDLDAFPPWANRFQGTWEERYQWAEAPLGRGSDALKILRRNIV
jgi:hypothetical protein